MFKSCHKLLTSSFVNDIRLYQLSTALNLKDTINTCKIQEPNPTNHTTDQIGLFYSFPKEDEQHLFSQGGLNKSFKLQCRTFNETCIMVRKPALDVINCLKKVDYSKPAYRFVMYGKPGAGKSISSIHILHYAYKNGFLLVHVPWARNWMRKCKESSNSESEDFQGYIDTNIDAAAWLNYFKSQNSHLLQNKDFVVTKDYVWSKREKTDKGTPLLQLIEHGINRIKFASKCVVILADEIKKISNRGFCKTLVVVDGFNAFFYPKTRIFTEKKEIVHPHKVTITQAFLNLTKFDWNNAAILLIVDQRANGPDDQKSYLPRYLLGKEGFDHVDPFVPVLVNNFNEKEFIGCMNYYRERKWVQSYAGQDEELFFISNGNPYYLTQLTAGL